MNRATKRLLAKQERQSERERARTAPLVRSAGDGRGAGRGRGGGGGGGGGGGDGGAGKGGGRRRFGFRRAEGRESAFKRFRRFLKEVRIELKKVAWPSRTEVFTYTVVVLVSVLFVTLIVFGFDYAFGKGVFEVFSTS